MGKQSKDFRAMAKEELEEKLIGLRAELAKERAAIASGTRPEKPSKIKNAKKNIARILTILKEKEVKATHG
ncbi:MAG: 50S ribosomal protein L29 [Candidatus Diapherotrites archaeon]|nr:50S ribosomal protein L29 [Candidatus Diapherotrites archaeon]